MKVKYYIKYEFCKSIGCKFLNEKRSECEREHCVESAKRFHQWLSDVGYSITVIDGKSVRIKNY